MTQALATAVFITAIWSVAKVVLDLIADDGALVLAALRGRSMRAAPPTSGRTISVRYRPQAVSKAPLTAQPQWRAAA